MNQSVNSVFAQMGVDVGMDKVMKTAGKLGMDVEKLEAAPAMTLGSMGASPLEMAGGLRHARQPRQAGHPRRS